MRRRGRRDGRSGQALIETAVTLPVLVALFFGFLAAGVAAQGYVDLNTAVYLAAASNATAHANNPGEQLGFATDTFDATVSHDPLLVKQSFDCNGTNPAAGGIVTCRGSAILRFSVTPLSVVVPFDPTISADAQAFRSLYRSESP